MSHKVIIVEDDQMMAGLLTEKLAKTGMDVKLVQDGESFFKEIEKNIPDIVLLDLILPGISGFDILAKIKSDDRTKTTPVIILSNLGSNDEIKKGIDMGADAYLIKSNVLIDEIIGKIEEVLKKKNAPQAPGA